MSGEVIGDVGREAAEVAGTPWPMRGGEHRYLSTGCLHNEHAYCRSGVTESGAPKRAGRCKFCDGPCVCPCHVAASAVAA